MKTIKSFLIMSMLFVGCSSTILSAQTKYRNRQWTEEDQKMAEERRSRMEANERSKEEQTNRPIIRNKQYTEEDKKRDEEHRSRIKENKRYKEKTTCPLKKDEVNTSHATEGDAQQKENTDCTVREVSDNE